MINLEINSTCLVSYHCSFLLFSTQKSLLGPLDVLYFADICAGPGGFSEYVLWRKEWHAKGFGFTLKGKSSGTLYIL